MSEFWVGQKVVCVDAAMYPSCSTSQIVQVKRGDVYTVRWVGTEIFGMPDGSRAELTGIRLEGIFRPSSPSGSRKDDAYSSARFRPLVSKAVQLFRKIAADATSKRKITVVEPDRVRASAAHNEVR